MKSLKIEKFIPVKGTKYAFIFGNEVDGVSDDIINVSDEVVEIPQVGTKHSLKCFCSGRNCTLGFFL
jgi:tRNA G18 (ribose-2'-O)-methylase SpoU